MLNRDGRSVEPSVVRPMLDALEFRAVDGFSSWFDGPVGFGFARANVTPEDELETQPLVSRSTGCVIVADVRLDNREELLRLMGLDDVSSLGDAELILRAYERWGLDAMPRLLGDFAFAIWDPR